MTPPQSDAGSLAREIPKETLQAIDQFATVVVSAAEEGSLVRLTVGKYRGTGEYEQLLVEPTTIKGEVRFALTIRKKRGIELHHFAARELRREVSDALRSGFRAATLDTCHTVHWIELSRKLEVQSGERKQKVEKAPVIREMNREKSRYIDSSAPYLFPLGITDTKGNVRPDKQRKYRQIDKFIEIVESLVAEAKLASATELSLVDYGSGKNYLTFALYDFLSRGRSTGLSVCGVELREDLVSQGNEIALHAGYSGLTFEAGSIADSKLTQADIVVALHACDTATDDAIAKAVAAQAKLIVVAPCCHKYVRERMKLPSDLKPAFGHGILEARMADGLTDGLRALALESFGYRTKVFEFIDQDHTAKNVMITAVRGQSSRQQAAARELEEAKVKFGLQDFYLDRLLSSSSQVPS